ncbi:MAG: TrkA family potassium uptake protein [Halobacteriales archaeon]
MSFVIVGGGRVGLRTARILREEGYDVVIVERDPDKIERIEEQGFRVVEGDGADAEPLEVAGIASADAVAGLTGDLNTNFAACMIGNEYGCRTVLRIDEDYRKAVYEKYADQVDEVIYPEQLGATGAKTALLGGTFNVLADLTEELRLLTVTIPEDSPVVGRRVNDLTDTIDVADARIYAHGREYEPMTIPLPGTDIEANDRVAVIADRDAVDRVRAGLVGDAAETEP